jgi:hypothetical protein
MRYARVVLMTMALAMPASRPMVAQESASDDSVQGQIRQTLRAFYFNLARGDWEALTADILAAKVVAHRSPPAAMAIGGQAAGCAGRSGPQIEQAAIALVEDWAEVLVPRCGAALAGGDQFRMIRFEQRWRLVGIHLFEEPLNFSTGP